MKVCDQANGVNDTKLMQVGMSTLSMDTNSSCKHGVWVKKKKPLIIVCMSREISMEKNLISMDSLIFFFELEYHGLP